MITGFAVVRPEPGNAATADALAAAGFDVLRLPLFAVRPVAWPVPDPAAFDALLLTSANAVRHGGAGLATLTALPVVAVGNATATAARRAGFDVVATGDGDGAEARALARANGFARLLHLAGREHRALDGVTVIVAYASEPCAIASAALGQLADRIVLLHSPRAAARLAELISAGRSAIAIAALSEAAAAAAGTGWRGVTVAPTPTDDALRTAAIALAGAIDRSALGGDKRA